MHDATLEPRWGEIALAFVEVQIRSGVSVPVEFGGGPIGTLDVYAVDPRAWDDTEVNALKAHAEVVASLLGAAARAEVTGALAEQLQAALNSRMLIEQARGAPRERERLDEQEAFTHLRQAAEQPNRDEGTPRPEPERVRRTTNDYLRQLLSPNPRRRRSTP